MFRAFRMVRFMRSLRFVGLIIDVLFLKATAFFYIFLMLFLFLIMFTLIGEQIYAGKLNPNLGYRENFDNFYNSLLSCFQILAIVGWNEIQILVMNTEVYRGVSIIFLVAVIVIGNYIFLNLFVGVLIGGFIDHLAMRIEDEEMEEKEDENLKEIKDKDSEEDDELAIENSEIEGRGLLWRLKQKKPLYDKIYCEESLFLFNKQFFFRKIVCRIVFSKLFSSFILLTIIFSSVKLALDTYDLFGAYSRNIDLAVTSIFIVEAALKIINSGFIMCRGSYMRKGWNLLDLFIVVISIVDYATQNLTFFKVFIRRFRSF